LDFLFLPVPRRQEVWNSYLKDSQDAWGEPCGKGLISIKRVAETVPYKTTYQRTQEALTIVKEMATDSNWKHFEAKILTDGILLLSLRWGPQSIKDSEAYVIITGCWEWGEETEQCVFFTAAGTVPPMGWPEMCEVIEYWLIHGELPKGVDLLKEV